MKVIELAGTTSGAGALTVTGSNKVTGYVEKIELNRGDWAANMDFTFTIDGITSQGLLVKANQGAADAVWYPRHTGNKATDATAFTNRATKYFLNNETVKMVLAQGGDTKTGQVIVHISDGLQ